MSDSGERGWRCEECGETNTDEAYDDTICNDCYIAELEMEEK